MSYGIKNVVGGFAHALTPEQQIPYTLNRTYHEHQQLRGIISQVHPEKFNMALELGCGYGRNLPLLQEFADHVVGIERDKELRDIAADLNQTIPVNLASVNEYHLVPRATYDLVLTFTFLQHLKEEEMLAACDYIRQRTSPKAIVVLCEESDPSKSHQGCWSRSAEDYRKAIGNFKHLASYDRLVEATFPGRVSGQYHVYEKLS